MHRSSRAGRSQRGNILFLILLAVVLFAALSYAVTQSMRGGGKDASPEKWKTQIADIENYVAGLQSTIMRMTLTGGVPLHQIDFDTSLRLRKNDDVIDRNNTTCTNFSCEVHNINGGGYEYRHFEIYGSAKETRVGTVLKPGHHDIKLERWENVGSDLPEIVLHIAYLDLDLGKALNMKYHGKEALSVTTSGSGGQDFAGAMIASALANPAIGQERSGDDIRGQSAWCSLTIDDASFGTYSYCIFVLMAR